ncbi:MAG: transglycosylase domain-containing protein [Candidatus Saccharibacteria bacterium]
MTKFKDYLSKLKPNHKRKPSKGKANGIRVNRNIGNRVKLHRDARARKRAEYLATLPKNPIKRFFYRLHPKRVLKYLTSREGMIGILKLIGVTIAVLIVLMLATFAYFRKDLPKNITDLKTCSKGASSTYYDRTGQTLLWASSGDVECFPVKFDQISPYLRNAVITSEDKDFYKHGGFSMTGVIRAGINDLRGQSTQGGSTITQQFVKNSLLTQEKTIVRKMKELILSIELERSYSKNEILNAYLNEIPFGSVYAGAEAASRGYFNKSAKDLTLAEATMLAAIIPAPTYYSPYGKHIDELMYRQHYILDSMVTQGYIKKEEAEAAKKVDVLANLNTSHNKYKGIIAPYFTLEVQEQLEREYGASNVQKAGFKVITTLDLRLQSIADDVINQTMPISARNNAANMAAVAEDVETGQVLAEVGGRDFNYPGYGQKNMATTPRSPGSSFKPYDYSSLMTQNKGWGAGSTLYDLKTNFGWGYSPDDYDLRQPGAMSMRYALGGSRNIPAIKAMYIAGIQNTLDLAKKMGVKSGTSCEPNCGLSSAIGDGSEIRLDEHVHGFTTLARLGKYKPQTYVLRINDAHDKLIKEWKDTPGEQVLDPQIAYIINDMISDSRASYFGNNYRLNNGWKSALKTGTTNNKENGWLLGFTNKLAFGLWTGRQNDINPMYGFTDTILGPAWNKFMKQANDTLGYTKGSGWDKPAGIKTICINQTTGYAGSGGGNCDIFPSWYQARYPDSTKKATIDTVSKKLATECTPEAAKQAISGGGIMSELPTSDSMYNNWIKPVMARYGTAGGAIPTDKDDTHSCDPADQPKISLEDPVSHEGTYTFKATVTQGKYPLQTVNFKIDGNILSGGSFELTNSGTVSFKYLTTYNEPKTVTAEVIDSVLYSATDSKLIDFKTAIIPTTTP